MPWFKKHHYPDFWQRYAETFRSNNGNGIEDLRFVVFDTETTGLDIKNDRILSIGCVAVNELKVAVSDQLELYLEQHHFDADTVKIHGLLKEGTLHKVSEEQAVEAFLNYIKNAVIVAHHAAFDVTMINACLKRMALPKLKNTVLDTGHLFDKTKLEVSKKHVGLDELADRFNIPLHDRHTASGDAYITALVFLKILPILKEKEIKTLSQLKKSNQRIGLL